MDVTGDIHVTLGQKRMFGIVLNTGAKTMLNRKDVTSDIENLRTILVLVLQCGMISAYFLLHCKNILI